MSKHIDYSKTVKRLINLRKLIGYIENLYLNEHSQIIGAVLNKRKDDRKFLQRAYDIVLECNDSRQGRKKKAGDKKIEDWMEQLIIKSPDPKKMTPVRIAYECRHYFDVEKKMDPKLCNLARMVKDKLYRTQCDPYL